MQIRDRDISAREAALWVFGGVVSIAAIVAIGYFSLQMHEVDAKINAQTEVLKTQVEQKAATQRTRERMHWLPWYSDEKNEGDEAIGEE